MPSPSKFTDKIAAEICSRIALGASVPKVASMPGMPSQRTIWNWLAQHEGFARAYAAACNQRGEALVDRAVQIAEETLSRAKKEDGKGGVDKSEVAAARLLADTLMRRAGQLVPRKYGPLMRLAGEDGGSIPLVIRRERASPTKE